jgi:hypothetical protein
MTIDCCCYNTTTVTSKTEEGAIATQWHNKSDLTVRQEMSRQHSNSYVRKNRGIVGNDVLCGSVKRIETPACEDMSSGAEERPVLQNVT